MVDLEPPVQLPLSCHEMCLECFEEMVNVAFWQNVDSGGPLSSTAGLEAAAKIVGAG